MFQKDKMGAHWPVAQRAVNSEMGESALQHV